MKKVEVSKELKAELHAIVRDASIVIIDALDNDYGLVKDELGSALAIYVTKQIYEICCNTCKMVCSTLGRDYSKVLDVVKELENV